jgi:hypothetical protein
MTEQAPEERDPTVDPDEGRVAAEEDDGSEALEHGGGGNG